MNGELYLYQGQRSLSYDSQVTNDIVSTVCATTVDSYRDPKRDDAKVRRVKEGE